MKKGGGTGPVKPWQPAVLKRKGAKSDPSIDGKDKSTVVFFTTSPTS